MDNKYIGAIIGVAVAIIVIGSLLAPVVMDVAAKSDTFKNDGEFYIKELAEGEAINYRYEDSKLYFNDELLDLSGIRSNFDTITIIFGDNEAIRYFPATGALAARGAVFANFVSFDLTVTDAGISGTYVKTETPDTTSTMNIEGSGFCGIVPYETDLVMQNAPALVRNDTIINVAGLVNFPGAGYYLVNFSGSIVDGFNITLRSQITGEIEEGYTYTSVVNSTAVNGYEGLYTLDSVDFNVTFTINGETVQSPCSFSTFVLPEKITADRSEPLNDGAAAIIKAIPLIVIISVILAAIAFFMRSRF